MQKHQMRGAPKWRVGGGGGDGNADIFSQQLYHHQLDHCSNSAKADEMPRSQRSLQSLLWQIGTSSHFICFDHPNSSHQLFSGILISSKLSDLLLGPSKGTWGQSSILASRNPEEANHPQRPWYGFFLIPAETMPREGKFICWCQKGKHNWHSQVICSSPMDNG